MNQFFMHVNNHVNRKSFRKMNGKERKLCKPSYTVVGVLQDNIMKFGVSICSKEDSFSKETGRRLALSNVKEECIIPKYVIETGELGRYFVTKAKRLIK